jgi:hypothetical protein
MESVVETAGRRTQTLPPSNYYTAVYALTLEGKQVTA